MAWLRKDVGAQAPRTGQLPGLAWSPWSRGDGQTSELRRWGVPGHIQGLACCFGERTACDGEVQSGGEMLLL